MTASDQAPSEAALSAIERTALDHVEGWHAGDADRMERCLHPDLVKRAVDGDGDPAVLRQVGAMRMAELDGRWRIVNFLWEGRRRP